MRHYKYETEFDMQKKANRARLKRFVIEIDKAAHGEYMNGEKFTCESTPVAISAMAIEAQSALTFR